MEEISPSAAVATAPEFNAAVDIAESNTVQAIADANKKALSLRPSALNGTSNAPCFVKIQELQETFEKQLKQGSDSSIRKLRELCESQKVEYAQLYEKEKARLNKVLSK